MNDYLKKLIESGEIKKAREETNKQLQTEREVQQFNATRDNYSRNDNASKSSTTSTTRFDSTAKRNNNYKSTAPAKTESAFATEEIAPASVKKASVKKAGFESYTPKAVNEKAIDERKKKENAKKVNKTVNSATPEAQIIKTSRESAAAAAKNRKSGNSNTTTGTFTSTGKKDNINSVVNKTNNGSIESAKITVDNQNNATADMKRLEREAAADKAVDEKYGKGTAQRLKNAKFNDDAFNQLNQNAKANSNNSKKPVGFVTEAEAKEQAQNKNNSTDNLDEAKQYRTQALAAQMSDDELETEVNKSTHPNRYNAGSVWQYDDYDGGRRQAAWSELNNRKFNSLTNASQQALVDYADNSTPENRKTAKSVLIENDKLEDNQAEEMLDYAIGRYVPGTNVAQSAENDPVFSSYVTVAISPIAGFESAANTLSYFVADKFANASGEELSPLVKEQYMYNANSSMQAAVNNIRQQISEKITLNSSGAAAFGYNALMSMADSAFSMALGGALFGGAATSVNEALKMGEGASLLIMGTNAGSNTALEVLNEGGDINKAVMMGAAAGTFEALFEKVSIDRFTDKVLGGKAGRKAWQMIVNTAWQSLTEGSEELATDIANETFDWVANGKDSKLMKLVDSYKEKGYSESSAYMAAVNELFATELGPDFLAGALSGAVFGGVGSAAVSVANRSTYQSMGRELKAKTESAVKDGAETTPIDELRAVADQYGVKYKKAAERMSDVALGKFKSDVYDKVNEKGKQEIISAYAERIKELDGDSPLKANNSSTLMRAADRVANDRNYKALGEIVAKASVGAELTKTEKARLNNNAAAKQVLYELDTVTHGKKIIRPVDIDSLYNDELKLSAAANMALYDAKQYAKGSAEYSSLTEAAKELSEDNNEALSNTAARYLSVADTAIKLLRQEQVSEEQYNTLFTSREGLQVFSDLQKLFVANTVSFSEDMSEEERIRFICNSYDPTDPRYAWLNKVSEAVKKADSAYDRMSNTNYLYNKIFGGEQSDNNNGSMSGTDSTDNNADDSLFAEYTDGLLDNGRAALSQNATSVNYANDEQKQIYADRMIRAYNDAMNGYSLRRVIDEGKFNGLSEKQARAAYDAGRADRALKVKQFDDALNSRRGAARIRSGNLYINNEQLGMLNDVGNRHLQALEAVSAAIKLDIRIVTDKEASDLMMSNKAKGIYSVSKDCIYIPIDSLNNTNQSVLYTLGHEVTHFLQDYSPAAYEELRDYVIEHINKAAENGGADVAQQIADKVKFYEAMGQSLTEEQALDEIVAEYFCDMLDNNELIGQMAAKNYNLFEKVCKALSDFIEKIRNTLHELMSDPRLKRDAQKYRGVADLDSDFAEMQALWNTALERAVAAHSQVDGEVNNENVGEDRYSVEKPFNEQVDDVINGTHNPRFDLYVSNTPEYLIKLNFSDSPLLMRNSKISDILNKHSDMSAEIIKQIPNAIENPLLVLKSKTHPKDSVVVITDISTAKGDMIVPVWVNQTGNYIDLDLGDISLKTNFVASAYGRNTTNLIEYAVNNDGVLYQNPDIKKVRQLLARNGLQLPTPLKLSASDIRIPQKYTDVNKNYAQNSENNTNSIDEGKYSFGDEDEQYLLAVENGDTETAQKLVDEAARESGHRIKGHHGTDIRFTIFDREKSNSSNDFGKGFYFSSSEFEAEQYQKDDAFGDTYNKIDGIAYDNALEKIRDMGEDANDDALFTRIYNEEFDKELKRRTDEGTVINAYLKMENPFIVSTGNWITEEEAINIAKNTMYADDVPDDIAISDWVHSIKAYAKQHDGKVDTNHFANNMGHAINLTNALLHQGKYDGVLDYTVGEKFGTTSDYHAIALYPNQIKSADTITYDDNGNVIPLSERFDSKQDDIRYSFGDEDERLLNDLDLILDNEDGQYSTQKDAYGKKVKHRVNSIEKYAESEAIRREAEDSLVNAGGKRAGEREVARAKSDAAIKIGNASKDEINPNPSKIERQNSQLKFENAELKRQMKPGVYAKGVKSGSVLEIAKSLVKNTKLSAYDIARQLNTAYKNISLNYGKVNDSTRRYLKSIAETIYYNASVKQAGNEFEDIKTILKGGTMTLAPQDRADIVDYNAFRQKYQNSLGLRNEGGTPVDSKYQELNELFPYLFPDSISAPADQLLRIAQVYDEQKPTMVNPYDEYGNKDGIINELVEQFIRDYNEKAAADPTFVDKAIEAVNKEKARLNEEYQKRVAENKEDYLKRALEDDNKKKEQYRLYREERQKTQIKKQIRRLSARLDKYLVEQTKRAYVPKEMYESVAQIVKMLDLSLASSDETSKYNEGLRNSFELISKLQNVFAEIKDSGLVLAGDSEAVDMMKANLDELQKTFVDEQGNAVNINALDLKQLSDVYTILRDVTGIIRDSVHDIAVKNAKAFIDSADEFSNQQMSIPKKDKKAVKNDMFGFELMSPVRFAKMMDGYNINGEMSRRVEQLAVGQREAAKWRMMAYKLFDDYENGKKADWYYKAGSEKIETHMLGLEGEKVELTKMQIMQLIMSYEREVKNEKLNHLMRRQKPKVGENSNGGAILFDSAEWNKGHYDKAVQKAVRIGRLTDGDIAKLKGLLDDESVRFMDICKNFFANISAPDVNKVTLLMHKGMPAIEESYVPFVVDKLYVHKSDISAADAEQFQTIEGSGFLKSITPNASQPLDIMGLDVLVKQHIEQAAKVVGLAIPIRNFNNFYNCKTNISFDGAEQTVESIIQRNWGKKGNEAIKQMIADLQRPRTFRDGAFNTIRDLMVNNALTGNISVVIKQAASYFTAGDEISAKSLAKASPTFLQRFSAKYYKALCDEIDAHTATHYERRKGMSTQELGDIASAVTVLTDLSNKLKHSDNAAVNIASNTLSKLSPAKWIQGMDCLTTAALWNAAKYEVQNLNKGIDTNSKLYWDKVTELYDRTIENTQPMYDVLHKTEMAKTESTFKKSVFMFMTQPLQNYGILRERLGELKYAMRTGEGKAAAKRNFAKAAVSQFASLATFCLMTMAAAFLTHRVNPYREDEGEDKGKLTAKSVWLQFGSDMLKNGLNLIVPAVGSNLYEFGTAIYDKMSGKNNSHYFELDDNVISFANEYFNLVTDTVDVISKVAAENNEENRNKLFQQSVDDIKKMAALLRIPAENLSKIFNGVRLYAKDAMSGNMFSYNAGYDMPYGEYDMLGNDGDSDYIRKEAERLSDSLGNNINLEGAAEKSVTVHGESKKLSRDEYERYSKTKSDYCKQLLLKVMKSGTYGQLSDGLKAEAVNEAKSLGGMMAKGEAIDGYSSDNYERAKALEQYGVPLEDQILSKVAIATSDDEESTDAITKAKFENKKELDSNGDGSVTVKEKIAAIEKLNISDNVKQLLIAYYKANSKKKKELIGMSGEE